MEESSLHLPPVNNIIWTTMSARHLNESIYGVSNEDQGNRQTPKPTLGFCEITTRIDVWMKTNKTKCDIVKGNFILKGGSHVSQSQAKATVTMLSNAFSDLIRLEGCLLIREFPGLKNLHFLSKLREVNCTKEQAKMAKLNNVIEIESTEEMKLMGLNSLESVVGPGKIIANYDFTMSGCFTKQEIYFYALHPQFSGHIYDPCYTTDPCLTLEGLEGIKGPDAQIHQYTIPDNCTIIFGRIFFVGPLLPDLVRRSAMESIEVIVGSVEVKGTLFKTFDFLPNLKIIYFSDFFPCHTMVIDSNQYLKEIQFPSLRPIRELQIFGSFERKLPQARLGDPCRFLPQFSNLSFPCTNLIEVHPPAPFVSYILMKKVDRFISYTSVILGFIFSSRSLFVLFFGTARHVLHTSRILLGILILISFFVALESCIVFQESISVDTYFNEFRFILPTLPNPGYLNSFLTRFGMICVAAKHAFLLAVPCLYVERLIRQIGQQFPSFIRFQSLISFFFNSFVMISLVTTTFILYSQLTLVVFASKILEREENEPAAIIVPLIINSKGLANVANGAAERTKFFQDNYRSLPEWKADMAFDEFRYWADLFFLSTAIPYHIIAFFPRWNLGDQRSAIYALLYLLLSANRLRWYIAGDIIEDDFCYTLDMPSSRKTTCSQVFEGYDYVLILILLGKIPYVAFAIVSIFCWMHARHYHILGQSYKTKNSGVAGTLQTDVQFEFSRVSGPTLSSQKGSSRI